LRQAHHYRPDIDGLRAIAVSLVVLYHYHLAPIPGGFVGVDIFFVISGFLITGILNREMQSGTLSPWQFYERRFRRIAPPLLAVIAATLVAAWFTLLPPDYEALGRQSAFALLGAANLFFWDTAGYFERDAAMQPLLHTWSLGVEEQFYLVWPFLFVTVARFAAAQRRERLVATAIFAVVAISFAASAVAVVTYPSAAFYLPMFRAWELAIGAALVFLPPLRSRLLSEGAALLGVGLIVLSSLAISEFDPFPGPLALLPCLGAALLIWPREHRTVCQRLLSTSPLVWIGKLSYSFYLWHWPVLVFARHELLGIYPEGWTAVLLVALCLVLSALTYVLIETPFRDPARIPRRSLFARGIPAAMTLLLASIVVIAADGLPSRLPADIALDGQELKSPQRELCHRTRLGTLPPEPGCVLGQSSAAPDTVLWGDSHGVELAGALADIYRREHRALIQITLSSCPPALNYVWGSRPYCAADNARVLNFLQRSPAVTTVVLVSRHLYHQRRVGDLYAAVLVATVLELTAVGKNVVVLGPTPDYYEAVPLVAARMKWRGVEGLATIARQEWDEQRLQVTPLMKTLSTIPGVRVVNPETVFCDPTICRFIKGGKVMLFDDNHPSVHAAAEIAKMVYPETLPGQAFPTLGDTSAAIH
jgi:peptidoglycan/LPS O-acetylase OafA/YrhL